MFQSLITIRHQENKKCQHPFWSLLTLSNSSLPSVAIASITDQYIVIQCTEITLCECCANAWCNKGDIMVRLVKICTISSI